MGKILLSLIILFFTCLSAGTASAAIDELERMLRPGLGLIDRVICVDGLKFFQTTSMGGSQSSTYVVSTIQMYETKGGKVMPATCVAKPK